MSFVARCSLTHLAPRLSAAKGENDTFLLQHGLLLFAESEHWALLIKQSGFPPVDAVLLSFYSDKRVMIIGGEGALSGIQLAHESAIEYVQQLLLHCSENSLSDLHLQPQRDGIVVRGREAGALNSLDFLLPNFGQQVYSRIKVLANLDLTEQRQPQDGRLSVLSDDNRQHEFRLSCCPVIGGEKLVLRCLQATDNITPLQQTGLLKEQYRWFARSLNQSQGLILVTGPTGSGKTSTLYSAMNQLDNDRSNVCSVEDPVEVPLPGCSQVMVNTRQGLTFAYILRTLLRQDPDVILIGEIRDAETAKIAIQAAQTGHLVLSSLHTNNCIDSIKRLESLGVNPLDIRSSLKLIVSQRLFSLREPQTDAEQKRQAVFEVVPWLEQAETLLKAKTDSNDLRHYLQQLKLPDFSQALQHYIDAGLISSTERERFAYESD
ncbi:GspE/PulE family protein [Idiomarina aminovorans]|uniref:GspE/PulE family protein n=1 Tax=Idiomarina aminovorans TaxID=2914829 RepID=UPI0020047E83|nr:ATPase, T2SS/T4P/T4SS family [Idiomarina sp. ATCH4]MCK7459043.1 Flp pilus assembly complex ATPase component TadA [Idiomarina sp. ATCH4]